SVLIRLTILIIVFLVVLTNRPAKPRPQSTSDYERDLKAVRDKTHRMERRINTLERLATDPDEDLDRRIRRLRDDD
ncbi:MAG: hypothetical protein AAFX02_07920, partial [Pseudomonadota bacterium]